MKRLPWQWGLALLTGICLGLAYAWVVAPMRDAKTSPSSLRSDFKDEFHSAIASAYAATGDLERARARMTLLEGSNAVQALTAHAQRSLAAGEPFGRAQQLAQLASDLQAGVSSIPPPTRGIQQINTLTSAATRSIELDSTLTAEALIGTPTNAGIPSGTSPATQPPLVTRTPIPSPSSPFQLVDRQESCDPALPDGLLQVTILDREGRPLAGIEITITWSQGEERFFTGLQPEISDGYADYLMQAGTSYSVRVARVGAPVSGLSAPSCDDSGATTYSGGLQLTFREP